MRCPDCKVTLAPQLLGSGLKTLACGECQGEWLTFDEHLRWLESSEHALSPAQRESPSAAAAPPIEDPAPKRPRLCPRCSRILRRLKISLDLPFTLDRCGTCNGLWFERGELEAIESGGMLPRLYHHLNDVAQHRLLTEGVRRELERQCREAVGDEAFERVLVFRDWLNAHPQKLRLWALLDDREPPPAAPPPTPSSSR